MNISAIDSGRLLAEMQRMAQAASATTPQPTELLSGVARGGGFGNVLTQALGQVNSLQMEAGALSDKLVRGVPGVSIAEAMIAGQKASVAFEATMQVRNRLVKAYQEVMNMPI